jgi:riboflavin synthase
MFTGIIQAVGKITSLEQRGGDMRIGIDTGKLPMADVELGDSIAVSGVCLTVVGMSAAGFQADVSGETLRRTIIGGLARGDRVNLEKALTLSTRLGGHLVSGHVDGVYIAAKGSITVDGVSLTVNAVNGAEFELNIVPHTLAETTLAGYRVARKVNLEVDLVARYLERLLLGERAAQPDSGGVTLEKLMASGFFDDGG